MARIPMRERFDTFVGQIRHRPGRGVLALAVLVLVGFGTAAGGRALWAAYHFRAAQTAYACEDFAGAREHLAECLKAWPDRAEVHLLAARAARRAEDLVAAEWHLQACEQLRGGAGAKPVLLEKALLMAQRGELGAAEDYLLPFAERDDPATNDVLRALARGYLLRQRLSPALYCLNKWLQRDPDNREALLQRASINHRWERDGEALADVRRLVELDPDHDGNRLVLAALLNDTRNHAEAAGHCELLAQRQPDNPEVLLELARCRRRLGRPQEARQLLDRILAADSLRDPQLYQVLLRERGGLALEEGQLAEAERWLRQAIARDSQDYEATYALYQCLHQLGKKEEAAGYQEKAEQMRKDYQLLRQPGKRIGDRPAQAALDDFQKRQQFGKR